MITLKQITEKMSDVRLIGDGDIEICGISHDSREVKPGYIFAAVKGERMDGTKFIEKAISSGAVAVMAEDDIDVPVPVLVVSNVRDQMGKVASACYGEPSFALALVGVTGTNGKTTITHIIETVLRYSKRRCGVMGTIEYRFEDHIWPAAHTTPESTVVQSVMRKMVDAGADTLAMEVSSHGLALGRLNGCLFDVVAFTNLTQDHLDFHQNMAEYGAAKMKLFTEMLSERPDAKIVLNTDDPFSNEIQKRAAHEVLTVSCSAKSDAKLKPVSAVQYSIEGIQAEVMTPDGTISLHSSLCGEHNLSNLLVSFGICLQLGIPAAEIAQAISQLSAVPGRLERVENESRFSVFVDYAHTPDALVNVLKAVKPLTRGRLICIFGCGGDRDCAKRPLMGEAVAKAADIAVVTSDNPRTEDPNAIIEAVLPGVTPYKAISLSVTDLAAAESGYLAISDRREAIRQVIAAAQPDDTVLIAGKGHEDYVIIGTEKFHFDDREEARYALQLKETEGKDD
ncbi:MAG: UDP-N-acetylmuramoyl-L-alanyl-D-glutamate--2,6-diaminopimelate ligase [Deltaproteobacteria bacterium]|nr:UDP-N-acetylmuramoyl-L-alanyl-D-glutamate--2,6-diaminopimelate ligase [Deltaproteobacteria bacterium]MBN2673863.1 UDP-N-acetylmuramoyl-L-alanyl-D-glutamate--2,6-diaminopimelate ligase [Deltaproteobacteria bacterium]